MAVADDDDATQAQRHRQRVDVVVEQLIAVHELHCPNVVVFIVAGYIQYLFIKCGRPFRRPFTAFVCVLIM